MPTATVPVPRLQVKWHGHYVATCLTQPEDCHECFVDAPLLLRGNSADKLAEAARIDRTYLLDQDAGDLTEQLDLRTERRGPGVARRRCYQHD